MAKTPIIPPLPEEEHFEQELGVYNYIPNDEDDGTGENLPHQKTINDVDDYESTDAPEDKEATHFRLDGFAGCNLYRSHCHDWLYRMEGI